MSSIEYGFAAESEYGNVVAFYRAMFPTSNRIVELMEWRRRSAGRSGGLSTFVARRDGNIVGAINIAPFPLAVGAHVVSAAWHLDSIVSPDQRGKGVGRELLIRTADAFDIVLAKGTNEGMYRLRKASGFRDVPNDNFLVRVLSVPRFGRTLKQKIYGAGLGALSLLSRRPRGDVLPTRAIDRFTDEVDAAGDRGDERPVIRPLKDRDFLNWRYLDVPDRSYRFLQIAERHGGTSSAVIRLGSKAWIVDLIGNHADRRITTSLVSASIQRCRENGAASIHVFATSTPLRECLQRLGFVAVPITPRFTYRSRPECAPLDQAFRNGFDWAFCHGDGDLELYGD